MLRPRVFWALGLALALEVTLGLRSASADVYYLNQDHSSGSAVTVVPPYGTVTLTQVATGSSSEITIVYKADPSIDGFHDVGFNYSGGSAISVTVTHLGAAGLFTDGPEANNPQNQMDGFGVFTNIYGDKNAGNPPHTTQVTLDITGSNLTLAQFENLSTGGTPSVHFAAGFVRTVTNSNGTTSVVTGWVGDGPVPTPEPSTLAIAGLGALGFIGFGLRRRLMK
jgi:hypothetical protein